METMDSKSKEDSAYLLRPPNVEEFTSAKVRGHHANEHVKSRATDGCSASSATITSTTAINPGSIGTVLWV
jgi:hypothetical protein